MIISRNTGDTNFYWDYFCYRKCNNKNNDEIEYIEISPFSIRLDSSSNVVQPIKADIMTRENWDAERMQPIDTVFNADLIHSWIREQNGKAKIAQESVNFWTKLQYKSESNLANIMMICAECNRTKKDYNE